MGSIAAVLTRNFSDNKHKTRAIFDWIAFNIGIDLKSAHSNDADNINSDDILKTKKADAAGYAALFQDMCSTVGIRCLVVSGYTRYSTDDIDGPADELNDTWDVVQLGESPDEWYYVDPMSGSGYTDK